MLGTGVAISAGTLWFTVLFMCLYLFIYLPVMFAEAQTMRDLFPSEYEDYSKQVPLFHARVTPYRRSRWQQMLVANDPANAARRFEPSLYLRHREYRAAFGLLAVYALLAAKLVLLSAG